MIARSDRRRLAASSAVRLAKWTCILPALLLVTPAAAQETPAPAKNAGTAAEPEYRDDRSDARSVIRSLYNAINRREYVRAFSYFRDEPDRPSFEAFAAGYKTTAAVELKLGEATSDGAAGSLYYALPVAIRSTSTAGGRSVFTGCYELRIVQPGVQAEPPFRPLGIVKGALEPSNADFADATGRCPSKGLR